MWRLLAVICILASAPLGATDSRKPPPYITVLDGSVDKSAIPVSRAIWTFFNVLDHLERNGTGKGMMILEQSVGLTPDQAAEFLDYASSSVNEYRQMGKAETAMLYEKFCVGKEILQSDTTHLTRVEWTNANLSMRMRLSNFRETRIEHVPSDMYPIVSNWVDENLRGNMRIHEIDREKRLDSMGAEAPVPELRRLCEVGEKGTSVERID